MFNVHRIRVICPRLFIFTNDTIFKHDMFITQNNVSILKDFDIHSNSDTIMGSSKILEPMRTVA